MHICLKFQEKKTKTKKQKTLLLHTNGIETQDWPACLRDRLQGDRSLNQQQDGCRKEGERRRKTRVDRLFKGCLSTVHRPETVSPQNVKK